MSNITKQDVRDFLYKVEQKATHAINEKWKPQKREAIDRYLAQHKELESLLLALIKHSVMLDNIRQEIKDNHNKDFYFSCSGAVSEDYRYVYFDKYRVEDAVEIAEIKTKWDKEAYDLRCEYNKIRSLLDSAKNGKKAMDILVELGFDVSSLSQPASTKINTSLLFPCGEKA